MEPENRQITIDEIMDSAQAAVEATLAQIYPPDPRREQHPEEYAITPASSSRLLAAGRIMSNTMAGFPLEYVLDGKTPGGKVVLSQDCRDAIFTAFKKKRVAQRDTIRLARKVLQGGKWWTVLYYGAQPEGQPGAGGLCYSLVTNDGVQAHISPATHPAFYEITPGGTESYRAAQREALGLPPEYKYMTAREWETLSNIIAVYDGSKSEGQELVFLPVPSAPGLYPPAYIGQASLERSRVKQGTTTVRAGDGRDYYIAIVNSGEGSGDINLFNIQSANALKLLIIGNLKLKQSDSETGEVDISLREFKESTGITDDKEARSTARTAILILSSITTPLDIYKDGKLIKTVPAGILQRDGKSYYERGRIHLVYERTYFEYATNVLQEIQLPPAILEIPARGNAFKFAFYINEDHRRNIGKANRDHTVSVAKLLSISSFPDPTDQSATTKVRKGQEGQRIIMPFLDTFDKLEEMNILTGELWLSAKAARPGKPRPLTMDEFDRAMTDYNFFRTLMVHYSLYGEPDYTDIVARREQYRQHRTSTTAKKQRKRSGQQKQAGL